jgi:hypothetical protein
MSKQTRRRPEPPSEIDQRIERLLRSLELAEKELFTVGGEFIDALSREQKEKFAELLSFVGGSCEEVLARPPFETSPIRQAAGPEGELIEALKTVERLKAEGWTVERLLAEGWTTKQLRDFGIPIEV